MYDFSFTNHGSITILTANTPEAKEWVKEHLPEDATTWGPNGTVIEPRYADDILDGLQADGLSVS